MHSLDEARDTLEAISSGDVDAVVVHGPRGTQLFHLAGPDEPFRAFVERMQVGAMTLTVDGRVLYANPYFAELAGRDVGDVLDAPLVDFVAPGFESTVDMLVRGGMTTTVKGECRLQTREGTIPVQLTVSPLANGACCAMVFDLRDREQAERAQTARMAAEEATRAKDRFLAVLSHELRSPLNTTLGWAQILASKEGLDDFTRRAAETILRSTRTQASLIADLLDISRIVAGKVHLEMTRLDLAAAVEGLLSAIEPAANERHVSVRRRLVADDSDVYGDSTRIQQICANLVNNALKFTEPGGHIDVSVESDADWVTLTVADTGIGMTPELIEHVFDAFHQGGPTSRRKAGLGLGLAIAKQLAEAHGGTLSATSAGENRGSTFVLRLPRATKRAPDDSSPAFAPSGELAGLSVLVVDDEIDALDVLRFILVHAGAKVTAVSNARDALAALGHDRFDVLITDIGLPEQDGFALVREVRARGLDAASLPAIAVTGYGGVYDVRLANAAGLQKHMTKPVDAGELVRATAELARRES